LLSKLYLKKYLQKDLIITTLQNIYNKSFIKNIYST
jgi:hypothetical protein